MHPCAHPHGPVIPQTSKRKGLASRVHWTDFLVRPPEAVVLNEKHWKWRKLDVPGCWGDASTLSGYLVGFSFHGFHTARSVFSEHVSDSGSQSLSVGLTCVASLLFSSAASFPLPWPIFMSLCQKLGCLGWQ